MNHTQAIESVRRELEGCVSLPSDPRYRTAVAIWARSESTPLAVVHCASPTDVQSALRIARESELPVSVRAGGHDFAGRALCNGIVLDLTPMRSVQIAEDGKSVRVGGGTRGLDVFPHTDPLGFAPVTGGVSLVGLGGLTLGGGYGPLIAQFGLACDNLISAEVVLADGTLTTASEDHDAYLLWALRGGGGNFGVVTSMQLALHALPSVNGGLILYPLEQAPAVFEGVNAICESAPDALTIQVGMIPGPEGASFAAVAPLWSGPPAEAEPYLRPLSALGTPIMVDMKDRPYGDACSIFNDYMINGRRTSFEVRWVPWLSTEVSKVLIEQVRARPSPLCSVLTHEFRGAAAGIAPESTAFGFREPHILLEILAQVDEAVGGDGEAERAWAKKTADLLEPYARPGSYANLSRNDDPARTRSSYGPNVLKLVAAKTHYDPTNVFASAIALPTQS